MMDGEEVCVVCQKPMLFGESSSQLTEKGCAGINRASEARQSYICAVPGQRVHQKCRQVFTNPRYIEQTNRKRLGENSSTRIISSQL